MKEQKVTIELVKGTRPQDLFNEILEALEDLGNVSDYIEHIGVSKVVDRHRINWWYEVKVVFTHPCLGKEKTIQSSILTSACKAGELKKIVIDMARKIIAGHIFTATYIAEQLRRLQPK